MKVLLKVVLVVLLGVVLLGAATYGWATMASNRALARSFEAHAVDFPIPFPLTPEEIGELGIDDEEEARRVATERAVERGRHLVEARYACADCHGEDLGGGVMVDAFPIGRLLGPNLTRGPGSRTTNYTAADWDRVVRHGILPDGRPTPMPSEDFQRMSDQELSDIITYIRELPPVDNEVPPVKLGPLGRVLVATGQIHLSADIIEDHHGPHAEVPPPAEVTEEFGRHLAGVCTGCHGDDYTGGPIAGGDPSWVPARNLTPHEDGLAGWTYEDFVTAMRDGRRPDGSAIQPPMTFVTPMAQRMTDVEMQALWLYLQTLPPGPTGD